MAKASGGSRNYQGTKTLSKRRSEFNGYISLDSTDSNRSYFHRSGGFVVTDVNHNEVTQPKVDKSDITAKDLARKGYKVFLDDERSYISNVSTPDGRVYEMAMDIKTINTAGKYTIKSNIEKAVYQILSNEKNKGIDSSQKKHAVILKQNCKGMTKDYVIEQLDLVRAKSPKIVRDNLDLVIVVGMSKKRNVHRHFMK